MQQVNKQNNHMGLSWGMKIVLLLFTILAIAGEAYSTETTEENLELTDTTRTIENSIRIYIPSGNYQKVKEITGNQIHLLKPLIIINNDSLGEAEMHTRGKSTLQLRRKSFSVDLDKEASLYNSAVIHTFKKFYAICLSMDKFYFRNRISFEMLKEIGLFDLFFTYSELEINDQNEGIYLLVERPQDWALKKNKSPCIIRRGFNNKIDKIRPGKKIEKTETQNHRRQFSQIYKSLNKYEGQALYRALSQWIDLDMYMKWLAFNFFIRNGDYTDEVYFFVDPVTGRYKIIPWDYDDVFASQPHEGKEARSRNIGQTLIFSSEDKLDLKIASDPFLYQKYKDLLSEVLNVLTPEKIKSVFERTYAELYPYYQTEEIISMSRFDSHPVDSVNTLKSEMNGLYKLLISYRGIYLNFLDAKSENITH